jgi:hypothetical protein
VLWLSVIWLDSISKLDCVVAIRNVYKATRNKDTSTLLSDTSARTTTKLYIVKEKPVDRIMPGKVSAVNIPH